MTRYVTIKIPRAQAAKIIEIIQAEIEAIDFSHTDYTDGLIHDADVLADLSTWEWLLKALSGKRPEKYVPRRLRS